jgi:hypothetical protein
MREWDEVHEPYATALLILVKTGARGYIYAQHTRSAEGSARSHPVA